MNLLKIVKFFIIAIAVLLFAQYLDYFISILKYPNNIYLDEGFSARMSLSFIENGIRYTNLETYPYIITIYGFLYDLVCVPLFYIMEPTINCGRIVSFSSTIIIIVLTFFVLRKLKLNTYYAVVLSLLFIMFKPMAVYTCYSKNDAFATLLTLIVLYSLYFHKGNTKFIVTLIFSALALMTKQTAIFIVPVVLLCFFLEKKSWKEFIIRAAVWSALLVLIFMILFLVIPNYYFNTITFSGYIGMLYKSVKHLIFIQVLPLIRATIFFVIAFAYIIYKFRPGIKQLLTPSLIFLAFYLPLFLWTSLGPGSQVVYFTFIFMALSICIGEMIVKFDLQKNVPVNILILLQLIVFIAYPSKNDFVKLTYNKPTPEMFSEAAEIEDIIKSHGVENSFVTYSWNSFGLSRKSAVNFIDYNKGYLFESNRLNLQPYINDFNSKKYSVIVGGLDEPTLKKALLENYYLYKAIGNTPVYLPKIKLIY